MEFKDTLNTKNLLTDFGCIILTGTAGMLCMPERKPTLSNDWREYDGTEYDLSKVVFKDKEVSLSCGIKADDDLKFWKFYNAFLDEWKKEGWQDLFIHDHGKTYKVFYKNTTNWIKKTKRLKDVPKVFVTFDLILQVK